MLPQNLPSRGISADTDTWQQEVFVTRGRLPNNNNGALKLWRDTCSFLKKDLIDFPTCYHSAINDFNLAQSQPLTRRHTTIWTWAFVDPWNQATWVNSCKCWPLEDVRVLRQRFECKTEGPVPAKTRWRCVTPTFVRTYRAGSFNSKKKKFKQWDYIHLQTFPLL